MEVVSRPWGQPDPRPKAEDSEACPRSGEAVTDPYVHYSRTKPQLIIINLLKDRGKSATATYDEIFLELARKGSSCSPSGAIQGLMRKRIIYRVSRGRYGLTNGGLPAIPADGIMPPSLKRGQQRGKAGAPHEGKEL